MKTNIPLEGFTYHKISGDRWVVFYNGISTWRIINREEYNIILVTHYLSNCVMCND